MSNSYWQDRSAEQLAFVSGKSQKEINKQLIKYYRTASTKTIQSFVDTYTKLLETVGAGKNPTPADLYNLDKYWKAQAQLKQELQRLGDREIALLNDKFVKQYKAIYEAISLPSGASFATLDETIVKQLINSTWCADGKNWSQRIWGNTNKLAQTLDEELVNCVLTGKKPTELKNMLQERFNVSYSSADMLVRTETAHIQTQAAENRYRDAGITQVQFWAAPDERTCEVCGELHEQIFPIGTQLVPAHPNCRCALLPVVED